MTPDTKPQDRRAADAFSVYIPERARRPGPGTRQILFAGVAGACALGVGLGLWARPAVNERQAAAAKPAVAAPAPQPAAASRKLEIVVDNRPAPLGAPIDVLPQTSPASPQAAPRTLGPPAAAAPAPLFAPTRPPQGLMRVQDVMPIEPPPAPVAPPPRSAPPAPAPSATTAFAPIKAHPVRDLAALVVAALAAKPEDHAKPEAVSVRDHAAHREPAGRTLMAKAKAASPKVAAAVHLAKAAPPRVDRAAERRAELARAAAAKAAAHKIELAQAVEAARQARAEQRAEKQEALRLAKAQKQEQVRLALVHRQEKDRLAKAARQQQVLLAKAEAKGRAEARAEAIAQAKADARNQVRLASLVHAVQRAMAQQAKPHAAPAAPKAAELARLDRRHGKTRHEARVEQASLRTHKASRLAATPRAAPVAPPPRASGLMRVSTPRCANRDAGEALVCADPALGAADRQLARAYQGARAAGVPDAQLQRQQQRWLAARSAAAREAPWAVHDVYLARIAELNSQARDANPED